AHAVLVFATAGYDQRVLLEAIRREVPNAALAGCSGSGVITRRGSDEGTHCVSVLAIRSDAARFVSLREEGLSQDPEGLGARLGRRVGELDAPRMLFLFPDGLTGNCSALLRGLEGAAPTGLPVFGGAAGELMRFERTFQYTDDGVASDSVSALAIEGDLRLELSISHGCRTLALEHTITRAQGGTVFEIDGRPAWHVMREYLDDPNTDFSEAVPYLGLAQRLPGTTTEVIRVPLGVDVASGTLFFPGELPEGATLLMARREIDDVISRSIEATSELATRAGRSPLFVVQADCSGRGRLLFGDRVTEQVIEPVQRCLDPATPWIGFHSYGEIAPLDGAPRYHNYTMALCAAYDGE
ncbi:MAG: FIST C-terminal domain-containing protein, partial [Myxococcales bacterium]|nr:FIST C-terminal domain-containing protein [Myxococcales bacterium]